MTVNYTAVQQRDEAESGTQLQLYHRICPDKDISLFPALNGDRIEIS